MAAASVAAPPLDGLRFVGTLLRFIRTVEQEARRMPGAEDLSIADLGVLGQIDRGADCPSQVARSLRLDPARVTHVTDRLVALGYVARASDPNDRRRWRLSLTVAGTARLAQGHRDTLTAVERLLAGLSADERASVALGMDGIRRELDGTAGDGAVRG
jgi:MarR family transcriptional regulator, lower aerobic nicotinate degradation pathway regulator